MSNVPFEGDAEQSGHNALLESLLTGASGFLHPRSDCSLGLLSNHLKGLIRNHSLDEANDQ